MVSHPSRCWFGARSCQQPRRHDTRDGSGGTAELTAYAAETTPRWPRGSAARRVGRAVGVGPGAAARASRSDPEPRVRRPAGSAVEVRDGARRGVARRAPARSAGRTGRRSAPTRPGATPAPPRGSRRRATGIAVWVGRHRAAHPGYGPPVMGGPSSSQSLRGVTDGWTSGRVTLSATRAIPTWIRRPPGARSPREPRTGTTATGPPGGRRRRGWGGRGRRGGEREGEGGEGWSASRRRGLACVQASVSAAWAEQPGGPGLRPAPGAPGARRRASASRSSADGVRRQLTGQRGGHPGAHPGAVGEVLLLEHLALVVHPGHQVAAVVRQQHVDRRPPAAAARAR